MQLEWFSTQDIAHDLYIYIVRIWKLKLVLFNKMCFSIVNKHWTVYQGALIQSFLIIWEGYIINHDPKCVSLTGADH